jgi:hypothetical protein
VLNNFTTLLLLKTAGALVEIEANLGRLRFVQLGSNNNSENQWKSELSEDGSSFNANTVLQFTTSSLEE